MMALTIWQPWASLIMMGAKPYEFRKWDFTDRSVNRALVGKRIVIHAGARRVKPSEVEDLLGRLDDGSSSVKANIARPLLERLRDAYKCRGVVELAAGLGTAVLGKPRDVNALFKLPDSDRIHHHMFAWPLTDIKRWPEPIPSRGFQQFWHWPHEIPSDTPLDLLAAG
jgi:hypothetical protein